MSDLIDRLEEGQGSRTLVMLETFPFFIVGNLNQVGEEQVIITPEFGVPIELREIPFTIRLDNIAAVFSEDEETEIPMPAEFGVDSNQKHEDG